jgi:ADP-ribose pyrophosphatase
VSETTGDEWPVLESRVEYNNPWYRGGFDRVEQPDGTEKKYYWAELTDATVVVARLGDQLLFVDQYRPTIRKQCLELPAGLVEDGESYEEAGRRELREETGYEPGHVELIEVVSCTTGLLRHDRGFVFADELEKTSHRRDDNEFLTIETVPIEDALEVARQSHANDATLEGILLAGTDGHITL